MRRFPLAFLLVGLLVLLAAGGAVLGAFEAPTSTDLAVHNGAGETLGANQISGDYSASYLAGDTITFVFTSPDSAREVARGPHGAAKKRRSVVGATAVAILQPINLLLSIDDFTQHGALYESTEPVTALVPVDERSEISGTYRTAVRLAGGYVVGVDLEIDAVEKGQKVSETIDYHISAVGSWRKA